MNIKELKQILTDLPDDMLVVLAKDEEGNNFSPVAGFCEGVYQPDTTWDGAFFDVEILGDSAYAQPWSDTMPAIVLWPTN